MKKIILKVDGMTCSACSNGLEKYLNKQNGISNASVNLVLSQVLIEYEDTLTINDLERFILEAGFKSLGIYNYKIEEKENKQATIKIIIFAILTIIFLYISMAHMIKLPVISFINMNKYPINYSIFLFLFTIPFLIYGMDIFKSGYKNLIHKMPNMDTLMTIGVFASFIYSLFGTIMIFLGNNMYVSNLYFESCVTVIFFIKLGRYIDKKISKKTKSSIEDLVQITPTKAILKKNNQEVEVTIDEVKKGDILICKPGNVIAVDGKIIKGNAYFDESFITGESIPVKKKINDKVIAGSINSDGYIEYSAEKIGRETVISSIVKLVLEATNTKAPITRLADKISNYFVPTIIIISIFTFIGYLLLGFSFNEAINSMVTVLVVACPCSLGLATPLAIVVSEGLCSKRGILVKKAEVLENVSKIDTIIFDKTGTLTYGNLKVSTIFNFSNYTKEELLSIVGSIEAKSTHPISRAFTNTKIKEITNFKNIAGIGLEAEIENKKIYLGNNKLFKKLKVENTYLKQEEELSSDGNSIIYVIENKKVIALIGIKDIVRNDIKNTIIKLKKLNKEIIMLTGDNENTANIIAKQINIEHVISNVLPSGKTDVIKKLKNKNHYVMMVGDGINDAPALATSNIGVSINSGTDIATNTSDVIIIDDNISKIIDLILISKKTLKNIKQNLFWAFFYNIIMVPIAIGFLKPIGIKMNPMIAALFMTISSLTVIINSLRIRKIKLER